MTEILISNQAWNKPNFKRMCGESLEELQCNGQHGIMWPYEPYTIGQTTREEMDIIRVLNCGDIPRNLHSLSRTTGQDNIVGVSDAMITLHDTTAAMAGSTTAVHAARSNNFVLSVQHYQDTLLTFRDVIQAGDATAKASAGVAILTASDHMQKHFQYELRMTQHGQRASRRGSALHNHTRAMNIARSSRSIEKLELVSQVQAGKLARFSQYGKVLGTGLVAIDFASRIGNVQNAYKAEGDWERELFIESSSFTLSALAGTITVGVGAKALVFVTVATPVGWVGLIVVAAGVSMGANYIAKEKSGSTYDSIMKWISTL
ncbi:MAG: hypothetical protein L3J70_12045 [Gammaproteobacteria bacterium]|nr:hypothetical protein [Gammaproteobacteria bacterium]